MTRKFDCEEKGTVENEWHSQWLGSCARAASNEQIHKRIMSMILRKEVPTLQLNQKKDDAMCEEGSIRSGKSGPISGQMEDSQRSNRERRAAKETRPQNVEHIEDAREPRCWVL